MQKTRENRSICVPFVADTYGINVKKPSAFREELDHNIKAYPELFPAGIELGYELKDSYFSEKLSISIRRIKVSGISYTIRPSFVMPYMTGKVDDVENGLFLRKFDVPFWALAHVFGKDAMYWYRLEQALGRNSLVGTTVRNVESIPEDLGADEKHSWIKGKKTYVATTVGGNCILGAAIATDAGEKALTEAYDDFKYEAQCLNPEYSPRTVNTDGWQWTQNAWTTLFPYTVLIACFLHVYIKIRDRSKKKYKVLFKQVADKMWNCYNAVTKAAFSQRVRRLHEWLLKEVDVPEVILKPIEKLHANVKCFSIAYDFVGALRTSNMIDRLMKRMDRHLFTTQYFHGNLVSAELNIRGWALIHNFAPSNPLTVQKHAGLQSPAEILNGHRYHDSWLQNLLISASQGGFYKQPLNPL